MRSLTLVAALAVTLTGCSAMIPTEIPTTLTPTSAPATSPAPTDAPPVSYSTLDLGICLASSTQPTNASTADPDLESVVECTEPHLYEITGLVEIPGEWIDVTASVEEIDARRSALLFEGGALHEDFLAYSDSACEWHASAAAEMTLTLGDTSPGVSSLAPYGQFWIDRTLPPADRIAATGDASIVCSIGYDLAVSTTTGFPMIMHFLEPGYPTELRTCWFFGEEALEVVPCTDPHWKEPFASFNAAEVMGQQFIDDSVAAMRAGDWIPDVHFIALEQVCQDAFRGVADAGNTTPTVTITAEAVGEWTTVTNGRYIAVCAFAAADFADFDIIGSRVGVATGDAELVRVQ